MIEYNDAEAYSMSSRAYLFANNWMGPGLSVLALSRFICSVSFFKKDKGDLKRKEFEWALKKRGDECRHVEGPGDARCKILDFDYGL